MQVRDIMSVDVVTVGPKADLGTALGVMRPLRIRHLPVVDGKRLVGLVTHRDLARAQLSSLEGDKHAQEALLAGTSVARVMTSHVRTVSPDDDVRRAVGLMVEHKYGCVPVVDPEGAVVGIITETDVLRLASRLLDER